MEPRIQYAKTSDGVNIAYSVVGSGPPLVRVTVVLWNHVEAWWRIAPYRRMAERLAQRFTFINYDGRGTGLSQQDCADFTLDSRVKDLEAVLGALSIERCALFASTHGCLAAATFAAREPDRVTRLILAHPFARGDDFQATPGIRQRESQRAMAEEVWEQYRLDLAMSMVDYADASLGRQVADVLGEAMTPAALRLQVEQLRGIDISDVLPLINVPSLIIYGSNRQLAELSRDVAARIPSARITSVEGRLFWWMPDGAVAALEDFLAEDEESKPPAGKQPGGMVTLLFTDIASSTALTQRLGDAQAQELLRAHNQIVREALTAHAGTEIKHTGDGIMASFPTASGALECAMAIQRAVADRADENLQVHIGVNAGEPVAEDSDLFGTSVQLARRICDHAEAGQILVSNVVRELAAGKGFLFADAGEVVPKGFDEAVRLYEVRWRNGG